MVKKYSDAAISIGIQKALAGWCHRYRTEDGRTCLAERPLDVKKEMVRLGYNGVAYLDNAELSRLGFTVVRAQYAGGAHRTGRFCDVIVLQWLTGDVDRVFSELIQARRR